MCRLCASLYLSKLFLGYVKMLGFKEFNTLKTMLENSDENNYLSVSHYGDDLKVENISILFVIQTVGDPVTIGSIEELREKVKQISKQDIF